VLATSETRVWFLRHGISSFNVQRRCQGCCDDSELTPQGREAARISGERLGTAGIQAVISSPLRRATDTAEEVLKGIRAQGRKITFETDARLREIELPQWERVPLEEIPHRFPEQFLAWRSQPSELQMQSARGEVQYPVRSLYYRVRLFWNHLLTTCAGKSVLLVTHGGTARALIASALGLGTEHFHSFQQSNCGVSRLRFSPDSRQPTLELLNDTTHLDELLPKLKEGRRGMRLLFIPVVDANSIEIQQQLAAVLGGLAIDKVLVAGPIARLAAVRIFQQSADSCRTISEHAVERSVSEALQCDFGDRLCHVAIVGPPLTLRRVLQHQLGFSDSTAESLELNRLGITSVHHPGSGAPPVLQAVNMFESIPSAAGVQI
jgi:phosphoserine phosphatase